MDNIRIFREDNGLEYIYSHMKGIQSCAISIMINTGSIYENNTLEGGAHLLEHLLFKGNSQYDNQLLISKSLERLGAQYNAYTDTNIVSFHIKVQKKNFKEVLDILGNMVINSHLKPKDIDEEKLVVIQELERDHDNPSNHINELVMALLYKGNNYSKPVGGSKDSVKNIDNKVLLDFWKSNYSSQNIVISIAGDFEITEIKSAITNSPFMDCIKIGSKNNYSKMPKTQITPRYNYEVRKNMKQIQLCIGFPTFGNTDPDKYVLDLINIILAGPMSSRLFVTLRAKYGLAYNVSSSNTLNNLTGDFLISCGVDGSQIFTNKLNKENNLKADPVKVILDEVFSLVKKKVSQEEINLAKDYIKGNLILECEDSIMISQYYGKQRIVSDNVVTVEDYFSHIDSCTIHDIQRVAQRIFSPSRINISVIGNLEVKNIDNYMKRVAKLYRN